MKNLPFLSSIYLYLPKIPVSAFKIFKTKEKFTWPFLRKFLPSPIPRLPAEGLLAPKTIFWAVIFQDVHRKAANGFPRLPNHFCMKLSFKWPLERTVTKLNTREGKFKVDRVRGQSGNKLDFYFVWNSVLRLSEPSSSLPCWFWAKEKTFWSPWKPMTAMIPLCEPYQTRTAHIHNLQYCSNVVFLNTAKFWFTMIFLCRSPY